MTDDTRTNDADATTNIEGPDQTRATITAFLQRLGTGDVPGLVELFADDASWEVPGDAANVPWLGRRTRDLIPGFFSSLAELTVREAFHIDRTVFDGSDAVLIGHARLSFTPASTTIDTAFAIHITVADDGKISSFYMFEDTWSVALAVRPGLSGVPARPPLTAARKKTDFPKEAWWRRHPRLLTWRTTKAGGRA